jgi:tetratricopeptide (TPR) repeat protein
MRHVLLLFLALTTAGCVTARKADQNLSWLRGRLLLVVVEGATAEVAEAIEGDVVRALALVPVRVHPSSADVDLALVLASGDDRVALARTAAEERRIPWLLVRAESEARIENARDGDVRWTTKLFGPIDRDRVLAGRLTRAIAPDTAGLLDPESVRLVPSGRLSALRDSAVEGDWARHREAREGLEEAYPADPAVRVHVALFGGGPDAPVGLSVVREMNPDGESELLALALAAEGVGNTSVALLAYEALVITHPDRLGYRVGLAEARMAVHGAADALAACRGGFGGDEFKNPAKGTAPHDAPDALPYADLRFHLGWYLAESGSFEAAALAYERAWTIYEAMGRPREQSDALNNAGVSLVDAGRPATAVAIFRRTLKVRRSLGLLRKVATTRYNLGRALSDAGRVRDALEAFLEAAEEYETAGRPQDALETRVETLGLHARQGRRQALEEAAGKLFDAIGEDSARPLPADVWYELGTGRMVFADHEGALDAFREAVAGYRVAGRRLETAQSMYSMATPHVALFRFVEAHADLLGALRVAADLRDSESIVAIRDQLDRVRELIRMGDGQLPEIPEDLETWIAP